MPKMLVQGVWFPGDQSLARNVTERQPVHHVSPEPPKLSICIMQGICKPSTRAPAPVLVLARHCRANNVFCCEENVRSAFSSQQNTSGERRRREPASVIASRQSLRAYSLDY